MPLTKLAGAPEFEKITFATAGRAVKLGLADVRAAKWYGIIFTLPYVIGGLIFSYITWATSESYWLIFAAVGFPLLGPFASVGLYDVSRKREHDIPLDGKEIFGVVSRQRSGQLPWLSAVIIMIVMFWFFLGHMIFALFLGLSAMTNISSSLSVFQTNEGISMLIFGTGIGMVFAFIVFAISVFGIPMLLDREIDFVTAMIVSFKTVIDNPVVTIFWAGFIVAFLTLGMAPLFFGLFLTMPLLGHASWHFYDQSIVKEQ
ncbi:MAG: DUF2189 domain-containing protein [Paracoccaceae bacterium]|nr:DUF2189 domain-containing protein [Paracoccaceae bacterium]MDG1736778.1 DUF2189 domain-containing protein [Paracoccaceae bacterium]MDG2258327.1 DUF2189 domain-containing protein [Paracoccaceae bacterium]